MGCLPLSVVLVVSGFKTRSSLLTVISWTASIFAVFHFAWYFKTLGVSLADKTGGIAYPRWANYMAAGVASSALVLLLRCVIHPKRNSTAEQTGEQDVDPNT